MVAPFTKEMTMTQDNQQADLNKKQLVTKLFNETKDYLVERVNEGTPVTEIIEQIATVNATAFIANANNLAHITVKSQVDVGDSKPEDQDKETQELFQAIIKYFKEALDLASERQLKVNETLNLKEMMKGKQ